MGWFHWRGYARRLPSDVGVNDAPTKEDRRARLADPPDTVLRTPSDAANWVVQCMTDPATRVAVWVPLISQWRHFDGPDLHALRAQCAVLAAKGQSIYVRFFDAAGQGWSVSVEVVTASGL